MGCSARLHPHDNPLKNTKASGHPPRPDGLDHSRAKAIRRKKSIKRPYIILSIVDRGERRSREPKQNLNYTIQLYLSKKAYYITSHLGLRPFIIPITPGAQFLSPKDKILSWQVEKFLV